MVKPFPTGGPIRPESRQIGRRAAIDGLQRQVVDLRHHTLLLGDRRIGKSSMAMAVLDRLRAADGGWGLEINLSRGDIRDTAALARYLATQARAAGVAVHDGGARRWGRRALKLGGSDAIKRAADLVGLDEVSEIADLAGAIDQTLAPPDQDRPDLRSVLAAVQATALASDRLALLFVDELQELPKQFAPDDSLDVQRALAEAMGQPDSPLVLLLAGSERTAIEELLAEDQPMHRNGMLFEIPDIAPEDWHKGLGERFDSIGLTVGRSRIEQILDASGGHPERTMTVCAVLQTLSEPPFDEPSEALVAQAIDRARRHPSWNS